MNVSSTDPRRVSNLQVSRVALSNITRTNYDLFRAQTQLSTGRLVHRPSDDAVKAASITILDDRLDLAQQRLRNLDHGGAALESLDQALASVSDVILEAKGIVASQINFGTSATERRAQAAVISTMLETLYSISNRSSVAGHMFAGSATGQAPMRELFGGYQYVGEGTGLFTDLGPDANVPLTLGAGQVLGAVSARVAGIEDLTPALTGDTRITDLGGARGVGVELAEVTIAIDGVPIADLDLTGADTVQDVADRLTAAIRAHEEDEEVTILGPGGISFSGGAFSIDIAAATPPATDPELTITDSEAGVAALDLGLTSATGITFSPSNALGVSVSPRLTWLTPVGGFAESPLGTIVVRNAGQTRSIDLSEAQSLGDIRDLVQNAGVGLRVEIGEDGRSINILNTVASTRSGAMSITEGADGLLTASRLGIRSFSSQTRISDFNDGRGVSIVTGGTDPLTGLPDPARDVDFRICLGNGVEFDVDLRPQDMVTVQTLIDRINASAAEASVDVPGTFQAVVLADQNGIALRQAPEFPVSITVEARNGSLAADQLGLRSGTFQPTTGVLLGEDRATVRVDSLFTQLLDLRDALLENDTAGIALAGERLESSVARAAEVRATVGSYAQRIDFATRRQEDLVLIDEQARSTLRDLDYTEAAVRFSLLQNQLQAGLQATAANASQSLLDFLG